MQDGLKSTNIPIWHRMNHVSWSLRLFFQKPPLEGRLNTKLGDHDTPNGHNHWVILFYYVWGPRTNRNSLQYHLVEGMATYDFTLHLRISDHTTWFWRCVGTTFGHFLLGSHNFMVTALGSCVKWPWQCPTLTFVGHVYYKEFIILSQPFEIGEHMFELEALQDFHAQLVPRLIYYTTWSSNSIEFSSRHPCMVTRNLSHGISLQHNVGTKSTLLMGPHTFKWGLSKIM